MNKIIVLFALGISGCGYVSRNSEMIGQVLKVYHATPIFCPDFSGAEISLGIMRNGVGSMSTQDNDVYVKNPEDLKLLKQVAESGELVKLTYDKQRMGFCLPDRWVTHVEKIQNK